MSQSVKPSRDASFRSSQRTSRRCTECARRKTKCSLDVPCSGCIQRGIADQCKREIVRVGGRLMGGDMVLTAAATSGATALPTYSTSPRSSSPSSSSYSSPPRSSITSHSTPEVVALRARVQELESNLSDLLQRYQPRPDYGPLPSSVDVSKDVFARGKSTTPYSQTKFTDPRVGPGRSEDRALLHPIANAGRNHAQDGSRLYTSPPAHYCSTQSDSSSPWPYNGSQRPISQSYTPEPNRPFTSDVNGTTILPPLRPLQSLPVCERCRSHNLECNGRAPCNSCSSAAVSSCSFDPFKSMSTDDLSSHLMTFRSLISLLTTVDDPMLIVSDLKRGVPTTDVVERYRRWSSREP